MITLDQEKKKKRRKINISESVNEDHEDREKNPNALKSEIFPKEPTQWRELKKSTSKQMLQMPPIALAQVKAGNTCEKLLNEIKKSHILCIKQTKSLKKCIKIYCI